MINNNQRDNQWASIPLGFPKHGQTIGVFGCTISVIGDIADLTPKEVNERLQKVGGFSESMVIWTKIQEAIPWIKFEWRGYTYDNAKVSANLPCLVEVDGTRIGGTKHWVLYIGNQRMYDPYTGVEKDTSYYPATGYCIIKKISEKPADTTDELKACLDIVHNKLIPELEGLRREYDAFKKTAAEDIKYRDDVIGTFDQKLKGAITDKEETDKILKALKEEDFQRVQSLAQKLLSRPDWPGITAEIDRLLTVEDQKRGIEKQLSVAEGEIKGLVIAKEELERRVNTVKSSVMPKTNGKGGENLWQHLLNPFRWIGQVFTKR